MDTSNLLLALESDDPEFRRNMAERLRAERSGDDPFRAKHGVSLDDAVADMGIYRRLRNEIIDEIDRQNRAAAAASSAAHNDAVKDAQSAEYRDRWEKLGMKKAE